ncbi:cell wall hydrolase [Caulobacter segnis]
MAVLGCVAGLGGAPTIAGASEAVTVVLTPAQRAALGQRLTAPAAREAITRVAYAEAAGQGDSGLAAVVFTVLNRLASGRWGDSVEAVVNARAQFEPVLRAGGDWRALPAVSVAGRARIEVMINLALDGRLPDPTGGALYFQNPAIVAARAAAGQVAPRLVHFGGAKPSVVIGDHAFYRGPAASHQRAPVDPKVQAGGGIFPDAATSAEALTEVVEASPAVAGERGLIVLPSGRIVEDPARAEPQP